MKAIEKMIFDVALGSLTNGKSLIPKILFFQVILMVFWGATGCDNQKFTINVDVSKNEIIKTKGQYYVLTNDKLEKIRIECNQRRYFIVTYAKNKSGIAAISVMAFGGYNILKQKQTTPSRYCILFVSGSSIKYYPVKGEFPAHSIEWIDNQHVIARVNGKSIKLKSPF